MVAVYDTVKPQAHEQAAALRERMKSGEVDAVTFTSSSTVRNFRELLVDVAGDEVFSRLMENVACLSIGPITSKTAVEAGLSIAAEASEYTIAGLVEATREHFGA